MPVTLAGLFRNRPEAVLALRKLKEAGFGPDELSLSTSRAGRRGRSGLEVLVGLVLGTVLGAVVGAVATGMVAGLPVRMAASGDTALFYEQEVESGRFLVSVDSPRLEEARAIMLASGAMEAAPVEAPLEGGRPRPESG